MKRIQLLIPFFSAFFFANAQKKTDELINKINSAADKIEVVTGVMLLDTFEDFLKPDHVARL